MQNKLWLDAFLVAKLPAASRARLQASIKEGLVVVNGRQQVTGCASLLGWLRLLPCILQPSLLRLLPLQLPGRLTVR